jgi:hypothetical protein
MTDDSKDFRYYADKAEQALKGPWRTVGDRQLSLERAELYVRLAAAAPKTETVPQPRYILVTEAEAQMMHAETGQCPAQRFANPLVDPARSQCTRNHGHGGPHKTASGDYFDND